MVKIGDQLRQLDVTRWNMVPTQRRQSLAEHTFMVMTIVEELAKEIGHDSGWALLLALNHDMDEVMTGDIPAPTKRKIEQATAISMDELLDTGHLPKWEGNLSGLDEWIVKTADYIADIVFLERYGHTPYASLVCDRLRKLFYDHLDSAGSESLKADVMAVFTRCGQMELP